MATSNLVTNTKGQDTSIRNVKQNTKKTTDIFSLNYITNDLGKFSLENNKGTEIQHCTTTDNEAIHSCVEQVIDHNALPQIPSPNLTFAKQIRIFTIRIDRNLKYGKSTF